MVLEEPTTAATEGEVRKYVEDNPDEVVTVVENGEDPVYFLMEDGSFTVVLKDGERAPPKGDDYTFGDHQTVEGTVDESEVPEEPDGTDTTFPPGDSDSDSEMVEHEHKNVGEVWDDLDDGEALRVVGCHPLTAMMGSPEPLGTIWFVKDNGTTTIVREMEGDVDTLDKDDDAGLPPALEIETVDADEVPSAEETEAAVEA